MSDYDEITREGLVDMLEEANDRLEFAANFERSIRKWQKTEGVELLSLVADLSKSEDKSRQSLAAEIKRLIAPILILPVEEA